MTFSTFSLHLSNLEKTSSRLGMTSLLATLYGSFSQDEIAKASYLLLGSLVPPYQSLEFQLSTKMVIRSLARMEVVVAELKKQHLYEGSQGDLFGTNDEQVLIDVITNVYKKTGDLGETAANLLPEKASVDAPLLEVYEAFVAIARDSGEGSQDRKVAGLINVLSKLSGLGAKYAVRIIIGKLRLGFSTMTILDALSWLVAGDKSQHELLEQAYQKKADIGALAEAYLKDLEKIDRAPYDSGSSDPEIVTKNRLARIEIAKAALQGYSVEVGVPFVPALCQRLNSTQEIIEKMGRVIVEPKYDGLRAQIHFERTGETFVITAYTRNLEDVTHMYPELNTVGSQLAERCHSCILDAEAIGYDALSGNLQRFQATITRKRKHDIASVAATVPLRFCVFDVLAIDGVSLIEVPLIERKTKLRSLFEDTPTLLMTPYIITESADELKTFHEQALGDGLEGAVIKKIDSGYVSGRKGWRWVKIKEEEGSSGKLADTLDLVVMGYYLGRGKRSQFGIGAFLVGVLESDAVTSEFSVKTIAKIGTGLTDDQFRELRQRCDALRSPEPSRFYNTPKSLIPDIWIEPHLVVEIAADEITTSPVHSAGVALRFPRLVRLRDDKHWEQATTIEEVKEIAQM